MLRRTLTALTPALFALPLLLTPTSQVYADADMATSVYSGLECKYLETRWEPDGDDGKLGRTVRGHAMEGQEMHAMGDVVYHSRLGIGNDASRMDTPNGDYQMIVGCPLPSLGGDDKVAVAVIDGTVFDDVTCRIQSCVAGIGVGPSGEGECADGAMRSSHVANATPGHTTQPEKYITQNVDWLTLPAPMPPDHMTKGDRQQPQVGHGAVWSHLLCTLPEQDDVSPEAPDLEDDEEPMDVGSNQGTQGISYIQSYYVCDETNCAP